MPAPSGPPGPPEDPQINVPEEHSRHPRRRRLIRLAGVAIAVLLTLFVAFLIALHTPPAKRWVLERLRGYLATQNIDFQADRFDYNLFDLSVTLDRVVVRGHELPDAAPFARIGHVDAQISLPDLVRGSYIIRHAHVNDADVHVFIDDQGRSNIPRMPQSSQKSNSTIDYLIEQFALANATVRYEDRRQNLDATLPIASITIAGDRPTRRHHLQLTAGGGQVLLQGRKADIERLLATLSFDPDTLAIEHLELGAAHSTITMAATAIKLKDPQYDFAFRASLDLRQLAAIAGLDEPVGGTVLADVNLRGPLTAITVRTKLHGDDVSFRTLEHIQLAAEANYDAGYRQAQLIALNVTAPLGKVQADGVVSLDPRSGESHINADVQSLDTQALTQALKLPYSAASKVDGHVDARWPLLEYARATGKAHLVLTPSRSAAARGSVPVAGKLDVEARNDARGSVINANVTRLQALGTTADARVTLTNQKNVEGTVHASAGDLAGVIAAAEAFLGKPRGTLVGTPVAGSLVTDARISGTISSPVVDATVNAPSLAAGTISGVALSADARYTPAAVTLSRADVTWDKARVHASGQVGLTGAKPIALTTTVEETPIEAVLAALGHGEVPATGIVSMQATANGTLSNPSVVATLRGTQLAAYGEALGTLTLNAGVNGSQVQLQQLRLEKPQPGGNGTLTASGTYDLNRHTYTVDAKGDNLRLVSVYLNGTPIRGAIDLNARGQGTTTDPALTGTFALRNVRVKEDDYGNITVDATVANHQAHVGAKADKFNLAANADVATSAPYIGKADIALNDFDLATLPPGLKPDTPLTGVIRAHVTASGDVSKPADANAAATIDRLAITFNGQPVTTDGPASVRYADHRIAIDRLIVHALDSILSLNGTLPLDPQNGEGTINLSAKGNLATLAQYAPPSAGVKAQGTLSLDGTIRGSLRRIDPALTLTIDNASIGATALKQDLTNVGVKVTIADGAAHVPDAHATWGTAQLTAKADVPFAWLPENLPIELPRQSGSAQIHAAVTGLDLASLPNAPDKLKGQVSMKADIEAPRPDITSLAGQVTFPDLKIDFNGLTLAQQAPSTIGFSNGRITIERFTLDGTVGHVEASGRVGLTQPQPIDLVLRANLDAAAAQLFTKQVRVAGKTSLEVAATGTTAAPDLKGFLELAQGRVAMTEPQIGATNLNLRIDFTPTLITLSRLDGSLNGGKISGSGSVAVKGLTPTNVDLNLKAQDVGFDQPMDLRSQSNADIRVTQQGENIVIGGQVTVTEAGLTDDINLDTGIFAYLNQPRALDLTQQRNPTLERVRFNLQVRTAQPILVDNNLAKADITANLRVLGTPYETGMSGILEIARDSELMLNERTYTVNRGVINFIDDRRIVPSLDWQLETKVRRFDITIAVTGTPGDTQTSLTSDPTLPEPDIMAMLVTGKTLDEMRGQEFEIARNQVLSYLGGRVGSTVSRTLQKATGLSTVRIEPNLIASETEPTARLTLGQEIAPDLNLVYSTDLVNSSDHIWMTTYDVTRQFTTRAVRQSDGSYRFDFRHDVRWGGVPEPQHAKQQEKQKVGAVKVEVTGQSPITEEQIRAKLRTKPGDKYDYFKLRRNMRKVFDLFERQNLLQARVRLQRQEHGDQIDLTLHVTPGPVVTIAFQGYDPPNSLRNEARKIWRRGVFDTQRADDVKDALKLKLVDDRYLDSKIEYEISGDEKAPRRTVTFHVDPGIRFDKVTLVFDGAKGIAPKDLQEIIDEQKLGPKVYTDPDSVISLLQRVYRERGYLDATLDEPNYQFDHQARTARIVMAVHEGPQFKVRNVMIAGNNVFSSQSLVDVVPTVKGDPFIPSAAEQSLTKLRTMYWSKGYNDVRPDYQLGLDHGAGQVDVKFNINEGKRSIVAQVDTVAHMDTTKELVRDEIEITQGEPLDLSALARSRKNLYSTGAFSLVDITRTREGEQASEVVQTIDSASGPIGGDGVDGDGADGAQQSVQPASPTNPNDVPVRVKVAVREVQPFEIQYGASYNTEGNVGGIFNIMNRNSLGKAREVGLQTRYDSNVRSVRAYMSQPTLRSFPIATIASIYFQRERTPESNLTQAFNVDRLGLSIQQEHKFQDHWVMTYGYRLEKSRTWAPNLIGPLPPFLRVAPLTTTLTRDSRDDMLDATNGSFMSQAFSYSPTWLGAETAYIKYFGQYFRYIALQPARRKQFTNEIIRPRLVYAGGVRLGLAHGMGTDVPLAERFLAGGSTTLRGFAQNAIGPIATNGVPLGGEAMLVINNEVRFPLFWLFDGVGFVDVGNVFLHAQDFSFSDLREDGGFGLRMRTPWFLLRLDYGVPLDRKPGESRSRLFFSIGQAF